MSAAGVRDPDFLSLIETIADSRSLLLEQSSDISWKLMSGSIGAEITLEGATYVVCPVMYRTDHEAYMPHIAIGTVAGSTYETVSLEIINAIERADLALECLEKTEQWLVEMGYKGSLKETRSVPSDDGDKLIFVSSIGEKRAGVSYVTELSLIVGTDGIGLRARTWCPDPSKAGKFMTRMDASFVSGAKDADAVRMAMRRALAYARESYNKEIKQETPYEVLLTDPLAFGPGILLFKKKAPR